MKAFRLIFTLFLLLAGVIAVFQPAVVLAQDQTPVTIEITAPKDKITVMENTVTVTGKVSNPTAKVEVKNKVVTVAADGTFSTSVELTGGENAITAAATLPGKEPVVTGITVYYQTLDIKAKFPKVEITSGEIAKFDVILNLMGELGGKPLLFDLTATVPKDWLVEVTPQYPTDKKIASIQLQPGFSAGENITVNAAPYFVKPDPGEYPVTLAVSSGNLKGTIELKAVITAKYSLSLVPSEERYNTTATADSEKIFPVKLTNNGFGAVSDINFTSNKPQDWLITFSPNKIDNLATDSSQDVNVIIKPPAKAIAGDYLITVKAQGKQATAQEISVRVTVETPTVWGVVGIIIIVVVIVGLVFVFRQFSRR